MSAIVFKVLSGVALAVLVVSLVSHHRSVAAERDALADSLDQCRHSNEQNVETIETLEAHEQENTEAYEALLAQSQAQADQIERLEAEREERSDAIIREIVVAADGDQCAHVHMPGDIRVRVNR